MLDYDSFPPTTRQILQAACLRCAVHGHTLLHGNTLFAAAIEVAPQQVVEICQSVGLPLPRNLPPPLVGPLPPLTGKPPVLCRTLEAGMQGILGDPTQLDPLTLLREVLQHPCADLELMLRRMGCLPARTPCYTSFSAYLASAEKHFAVRKTCRGAAGLDLFQYRTVLDPQRVVRLEQAERLAREHADAARSSARGVLPLGLHAAKLQDLDRWLIDWLVLAHVQAEVPGNAYSLRQVGQHVLQDRFARDVSLLLAAVRRLLDRGLLEIGTTGGPVEVGPGLDVSLDHLMRISHSAAQEVYAALARVPFDASDRAALRRWLDSFDAPE